MALQVHGFSRYLKSIADTVVNGCDEIIIVMDNLSARKTNTIATNLYISVLCNEVLLAIIVILIITIIC